MSEPRIGRPFTAPTTRVRVSEQRTADLRWNAQEDAAAALSLDVYDPVQVERGPLLVSAEIISLKHSITPTRWMVDVELTNNRTGAPFETFNTAIGSMTFAQLNTLLGSRTFAQFAADPLKDLT